MGRLSGESASTASGWHRPGGDGDRDIGDWDKDIGERDGDKDRDGDTAQGPARGDGTDEGQRRPQLGRPQIGASVGDELGAVEARTGAAEANEIGQKRPKILTLEAVSSRAASVGPTRPTDV